MMQALLLRRREWLVVAVLPLLLAFAMSARHEASLLRPLGDWLRVNGGDDSWGPMQRAFELLRDPATRVYEVLFFGEGVKFQYPPTSLLLHEAAARIGAPLTVHGLNLANWVLVWVFAAGCALFAARVVAMPGGRSPAPADRAVAAALGACAALLAYPVLKAFLLGQVQLAIDAAFVAACLAWVAGRKFACGMLVGAVCLVKPQFSLFLAWGLLRGELRFVAGWGAVVGAGLAASLALYGLQNHLDYLRVLGALSATGEAYHPNQSVNGVLNRLLGTAPATLWMPHGFPPPDPLVRAGTLATSAALVAAALLYRRKARARILDFQGAALAFTMAAPIAWEHHYGILVPILLALHPALARLADARRRRVDFAVLAACSVLAGGHFGIAHHADAGAATLLHAYLFVAAGGVLWLLVDATRGRGARRAWSRRPAFSAWRAGAGGAAAWRCPSRPARARRASPARSRAGAGARG